MLSREECFACVALAQLQFARKKSNERRSKYDDSTPDLVIETERNIKQVLDAQIHAEIVASSGRAREHDTIYVKTA